MDVHRGKSGISLRQKSNLLLPITKKCRKRRLTFIIEKYSKVFKINEIKKRREKRDKINVSLFFSIMPQTGIEPVREYKSRRILSPVRLPVPPLRHTKYLLIPFKKITSQPHICSQPCQFRLRNCVHHHHSFKIQSILNGWRRIRTFEGVANRFTVCPLWPLGNPSIFLKQIASTSIYLYHICSENASNFLSFLHPSVCMLYLAYLSKIIFQFCKISFFHRHGNPRLLPPCLLSRMIWRNGKCLILRNTRWKHH